MNKKAGGLSDKSFILRHCPGIQQGRAREAKIAHGADNPHKITSYGFGNVNGGDKTSIITHKSSAASLS